MKKSLWKRLLVVTLCVSMMTSGNAMSVLADEVSEAPVAAEVVTETVAEDTAAADISVIEIADGTQADVTADVEEDEVSENLIGGGEAPAETVTENAENTEIVESTENAEAAAPEAEASVTEEAPASEEVAEGDLAIEGEVPAEEAPAIGEATEEVEEPAEAEEKSYPEIHFDKIYDSIRITVDAPEGAFEDGVGVYVTPIKEQKDIAQIADTLDSVTGDEVSVTEENIVAYDISFRKDADGDEIQPAINEETGEAYKVNVKFYNVDKVLEEAEEVQVFHMEDVDSAAKDVEEIAVVDTDTEEVTVEAEDSADASAPAEEVIEVVKSVEIEADAFSIYVLVGNTSYYYSSDSKVEVKVGETKKVVGFDGTIHTVKNGTTPTVKFGDGPNVKSTSEYVEVTVIDNYNTSDGGPYPHVEVKGLKESKKDKSGNYESVKVTVYYKYNKNGNQKDTSFTFNVVVKPSTIAPEEPEDPTPTGMEKVAVLATCGDTQMTPDMAELLGLDISAHNKHGYYPVGVIYLDSSFFDNPKASGTEKIYINKADDYIALKKAIGEIDKSLISDNFSGNRNNNVQQYVTCMQEDVGQHSGSGKTALFSWNKKEQNELDGDKRGSEFLYQGDGDKINKNGEERYYKYHLDMRFATAKVRFLGVYDENRNYTPVKLSDKDRNYIVDAVIKEPGTSSDKYLNIPNGYTIEGYYYDKGLTKPVTFDDSLTASIDKSKYDIENSDVIKLYAKLVKEKTYTVTYDLNGGKSSSTKLVYTEKKYNDDMPTIEEPTREGFTFVGWNDGERTYTGYNDYYFPKYVIKDVTFEAQWNEIEKYTVTFDGNGGYFDNDTSETEVKHSNILSGTQFPEAPTTVTRAEDDTYTYEFAGWSTDKDADVSGAIDASSLPETVTENVAYYAVWEPTYKTYTVTFNANGGVIAGTSDVTKTETGLHFGDGFPDEPEVTRADPNKKVTYEFKGWATDKNATETVILPTTVAGDATYYAVWEAENVFHTVTYDANGGKYDSSLVAPEKGVKTDTTYTYNEAQNGDELPEAPAKEMISKDADEYNTYKFLGWAADKGATSATSLDGVKVGEDDVTYYAVWKATKIEYTIIYDLNGGTVKDPDAKSDGTVEKKATYGDNLPTIADPTKTANDGKTYIFDGWVDDEGNIYSKEVLANEKVTGDATYKAKWTEAILTATNYEGTYDGEAHSITVSSVIDNGSTATVTNIKYSTTDSSDESNWLATPIAETNATESPVTVYVKGTVVGHDDVELKTSATITINKRPVTVSVKPATYIRNYDGSAITAKEVIAADTNSKGYVVAEAGEGTGLVTGDSLIATLTVDENVDGVTNISGDSALSDVVITKDDGTIVTANYDITTNGGTVSINDENKSLTLTITGKTVSKEYNGYEQTLSGDVAESVDNDAFSVELTKDGIIFDSNVTDNYTVTGITASAKGRDAGNYALTYDVKNVEITDKNGKDVTQYFNVVLPEEDSNDYGKLTITKAKLTATAETREKQYDGTSLSASCYFTGLVGGDTWKSYRTKYISGQNDSKQGGVSKILPGEVKYTIKEGSVYLLSDSQEVLATRNYDVTYEPGTLTILKKTASLVITGKSLEFTYDGTVKSAKSSDYDYTLSSGKLAEGDTLSVTVSGSATDANVGLEGNGTPAMITVSDAKITRKNGNTYSAEELYSSVTYNPGTLTIKPRKITLKANGGEKTYDGKELVPETVDGKQYTITNTAEDEGLAAGQSITATVGGSRTEVGESNSWIEKDSVKITASATTLTENDVTNNYAITLDNGALKVNAIESITVHVKGTDAEYFYDGENHTLDGFEFVSAVVDGEKEETTLYTANDFAKSDSFTGITRKNAFVESDDAAGTDMTDGLGAQYAEGLTGDVSKFFVNDNKNFTTVNFVSDEDGTLTIKKRSVTLTSPSESKYYDGTALECFKDEDGTPAEGYAITATEYAADGKGFVPGESVVEIYDTETATITNVGTADNEFTYKVADTDENTKLDNYKITKSVGRLEVKPLGSVTVYITGHINEVDYDGKAHTVTGYDVKVTAPDANSESGEMDITEFFGAKNIVLKDDATAEITKTDAGTYNMNLKADSFDNKNANFTNVVFKIVEDGSLKINPAHVTIKVQGKIANKTYNSKAQSLDGCDVAGVVYTGKDEAATSLLPTATAEAYTVATVDNQKKSLDDLGVSGTTVGSYELKTEHVSFALEGGDGFNADNFYAEYEVVEPKDMNNNTQELVIGFLGSLTPTPDPDANPRDFLSKLGIDKLPVEIEVTANSGSVDIPYDGNSHTVSGYTVTNCSDAYDLYKSGLEKGYTEIVYNGNDNTATGTLPNEYVVPISGDKLSANDTDIMPGYNNNFEITYKVVTGRFKIITRPDGSKINVTLTAGTKSKDYDGTALSDATYTMTTSIEGNVLLTGDSFNDKDGKSTIQVAGEIVDVRYDSNGLVISEPNKITGKPVIYHKDTVDGVDSYIDVTDNYVITTVDGALTINPLNVELTAASDSKEWNGIPLKANEITGAKYMITSGVLAAPNLDAIDGVKLTGEQTYPGESDSAIVEDSVKVINNAGNDVTRNYKFTFKPGKLTVTRPGAKTLTIHINGNEKVYDGTALLPKLNADGKAYTVAGLVTGDKLNNVVVNGSLVDAGEMTPTISFEVVDKDGNNVTVNYRSSVTADKLVVTQRPLPITASSLRATYDGAYHPVTTYKPLAAGTLATGDRLDSVVITGTARDAGSYLGVAKVIDVTVLNSIGEDVTKNYKLIPTPGDIIIDPAPGNTPGGDDDDDDDDDGGDTPGGTPGGDDGGFIAPLAPDYVPPMLTAPAGVLGVRREPAEMNTPATGVLGARRNPAQMTAASGVLGARRELTGSGVLGERRGPSTADESTTIAWILVLIAGLCGVFVELPKRRRAK